MSDSTQPRSILRATGRASLKRPLIWDESNLDLNESEKIPRMKIDEPKTPYHKQRKFEYTSDDTMQDGCSDESEQQHGWDWEDEEHTISDPTQMDDVVQINDTVEMSKPDDDVSDDNVADDNQSVDDSNAEEDRPAHEKFEAMRSAHYKMGDLLRAHNVDDDEDDEDAEP